MGKDGSGHGYGGEETRRVRCSCEQVLQENDRLKLEMQIAIEALKQWQIVVINPNTNFSFGNGNLTKHVTLHNIAEEALKKITVIK